MAPQQQRADRLAAQLSGGKERADGMPGGAKAEQPAERELPALHRAEHDAPARGVGKERRHAEGKEDDNARRLRSLDGREQIPQADVDAEKRQERGAGEEKRDAQLLRHERKPAKLSLSLLGRPRCPSRWSQG